MKGENSVGFQETARFEHRFWLQVMGDHARFIRDSLSIREEKEIAHASYFIDRYDTLLQAAQANPVGSTLTDLSATALKLSTKFRAFKLHLLRRHIAAKISIMLPPTFINHMVNEIEEYMRILRSLCAGQEPVSQHPVHHHLLWLQDAIGHAATIQSQADPVEQKTADVSLAFRKQFEAYYLKAVELAGYLRTELHEFPALSRFNSNVGVEMGLFTKFLQEIEELRLTDEVLGALAPLLPDHMAREECYYLMKLAEVTVLPGPLGDPTAPRIES